MRPQFSLQSYDFPAKKLYINEKNQQHKKLGFLTKFPACLL